MPLNIFNIKQLPISEKYQKLQNELLYVIAEKQVAEGIFNNASAEIDEDWMEVICLRLRYLERYENLIIKEMKGLC